MNDAKSITKIFKALSDETRLNILKLIKECECSEESCDTDLCINDFSKKLNVQLPTISHHMKELVNAGLVKTNKKGKYIYCTLYEDQITLVMDYLNKLKK